MELPPQSISKTTPASSDNVHTRYHITCVGRNRTMSGFAALPAEVQELIRSRQAEAKRSRLDTKRAKSQSAAAAPAHPPSPCSIPPTLKTGSAAPPPPPLPLGDSFPDKVSMENYFAAAPGGLFRDPSLAASVAGVDLLLSLLDDPDFAQLRTCNYFMFCGAEEQQWDSTLLAKLAYEGFFTITHKERGRRGIVVVPLPELQPMYAALPPVRCCGTCPPVNACELCDGERTAGMEWWSGGTLISHTTIAPSSARFSAWCRGSPSAASCCASTATRTPHGAHSKRTIARTTAATG